MTAMDVKVAVGFSPDSIYATWNAGERTAADLMEDRFNADQRCLLAEHVGTSYVRVADDDSLRDLTVTYRRQREDIGSGALVGGAERDSQVAARLSDVQREQEIRASLAASWLASDRGTHSFTAYHARGGLEAVSRYGATPPSYHLAALLDQMNYRRGLPHVLAWKG